MSIPASSRIKPLLPARLVCFLILGLAPAGLAAQAVPRHGPAPPRASESGTVPALLLSDIHFDSLADSTRVAALNAAPAAEWPRILADSRPIQPITFKTCPNESDTSYTLWQSTLPELKRTAAASRFVVLSGDLLGHNFDCKYRELFPRATKADYLAFTVKTVQYVLTTLHEALPGLPIYTAMGNNDSGCSDNALDPRGDAFLAAVAPLVAQAADAAPSDRAGVERDFAALGAFNLPLAGLPHTRVVTLDDLYLSGSYLTCSGARDATPGAAAIAWLKTQLDAARAAHERVWFVSHIPPGVDLYATARKLVNVCGGAKPTMFLASEDLAETLAAYSDVVRLALFGHTHDDELRLLTENDSSSRPEAERSTAEVERPSVRPITGVPLKIAGSISPVHGNRPTFTLARVNPADATLTDYTVMMASNPMQPPITWAPEYTYSTTYHEPAFDAASLAALIADFQGDPGDRWPSSQAYIRNYFPAAPEQAVANAALISGEWKPYACSLNHDSARSFAACACAK